MNQKQLLGVIGSALLFFGVFCPIISVPVVGNINYLMNGKGDGTIVLILAIISFVLTLMKKYKALWFTGLGSATVILFTFINLQVRLSSMRSKMTRELADNPFAGFAETMTQAVQLQWGWPLLIIGVVLLIICAAIKFQHQTEPITNYGDEITPTKYCPQCGTKIQPSDSFCNNCGTAAKNLASAFAPVKLGGASATGAFPAQAPPLQPPFKKRKTLVTLVVGAALIFAIGLTTYVLIPKGSPAEQCEKGNDYFHGRGVAKDYLEAVKWYRRAAKRGYVDAQNNLGDMYYMGNGVSQDYVEAAKWYRLAADQGYAVAQNNLGAMYDNGHGVDQDYVEAAKWYRLAADQGYAVAQNNLGAMYHSGRGVGQDYVEAVKWYRLAAGQGNAVAQNNLGAMYHSGQGVGQNYYVAANLFHLAADQGNAIAQNNMGEMYYYGGGVGQDYVEAVKWYRLAADQGKADAQYSLGYMYLKGKGVAKNRDEAVKWLRLAANQGQESAKKLLSELSQ